MYKGYKILGIVPARAGSKGIINKNMFSIFDKPLIAYTLEQAKKSKYLDDVIVSTDSPEILEYAVKTYNCKNNGFRPQDIATDTSPTIAAVLHELKNIQPIYDAVALLQPTQPLRQAFHIDEAIEIFVKYNMQSVVGITPAPIHPQFLRRIENGKLHSYNTNSSTIRRQELSPYYYVNGMVYINAVSTLDNNTSFNDNIIPYIIDEKYAVDIDVVDDVELFKMKYEKINFLES